MEDYKGIIEKTQRILPILDEAQKRVYLHQNIKILIEVAKPFF